MQEGQTMQKAVSLISLATFALFSLVGATHAIQLGVPSYYSPGAAAFTTIANTGSKTGIMMLNIGNGEINPNDGSSYDSEPLGPWVTQSQESHTANTKVFCYVHSSYGARSLSLVEGDVDAYFSAGITVDGIFVDEADTTWANTGASYYEPLYNYIKSKYPGTLVAINPGTIPDGPNWMDYACDICMDFEDNYAKYSGVFVPSWVNEYPANRFWQAVLKSPTTTAAVDSCFATAAANNCGYLYVTNLTSKVNTYGALPNSTVWNEEVADATGPGGNFSNESAWNDGTNFYYQASYLGSYSHFNVLLDTDDNVLTGYRINGIGADDLIEDTGLFAATANGNTWSWSSDLAAVSETSPSSGTVLFSVPLSVIGSPAMAKIAFQGTDASYNPTNDPTVVSYVSSPIDASNAVTVTRGGLRYNIATHLYGQSITLTNTGSIAILGPISLVLTSLSSNASLYNAIGTTGTFLPASRPYVNAAGLAVGASEIVPLEFTDSNIQQSFTYTTQILAGSGPR